jgi:hypothetical protein
MADHHMKTAGQARTTIIGLYIIAMAMLLTYSSDCANDA